MMAPTPSGIGLGSAHEEACFAALPQLAQEEIVPEINSVCLGPGGELIDKGRPRQRIVTYEHAGQRITARFEGARDEPILLELGCRLIRIPYQIEAPEQRRELVRRVFAVQQRKSGRLAITPQQWLYYRDRMRLPPASMTASWLLGQLTLATLLLDPIIGLFAELAGPETGLPPRSQADDGRPAPDRRHGRVARGPGA